MRLFLDSDFTILEDDEKEIELVFLGLHKEETRFLKLLKKVCLFTMRIFGKEYKIIAMPCARDPYPRTLWNSTTHFV